MAGHAHITSLEAIEAFRANLIIYLGRARAATEEVGSDIQRAKMWIQNDQRRNWEHERKVRGKKLEAAQNELFSARLSTLQQATTVQFMARQRAEREVREADEKLAVLKKWDRELENRSEPLLKQVDQLQSFLTTEMPRAVSYLTETIKILEAYADVPMPGGGVAEAPKVEPLATPAEGKSS